MTEIYLGEQAGYHALGEQTRSSIRDKRINYFVAWLPVLDAAFIGLSFVLAYWLRFEVLSYYHTPSVIFYSLLGISVIPLWLLIFYLWKLYNHHLLLGGTKEYAHVINACTSGIVAILFYSFLFLRDAKPGENISRIWLMMVWGLSILLVGSYRFWFRRLVYHLRKKGYLLSRAIIVGAGEESRVIIDQLRSASSAGITIVGIVDDHRPKGSRIDGLPVLGNSDALSQLVEQYQADELIISSAALSHERLLDIYRTFGISDEVEVRLSPGLFELFTTGVKVQEVGFVPFISLNKLRIVGLDAFLKKLLDYVLTVVGLILLSPLLLAIAILIKLTSPGPAIYRRRVLGTGGRTFDAFKFRTMREDGDAYLQKHHPALAEELKGTGKLKDDPRVTPLGRFLRKYSLDELPQLCNVLLGQMSLVGPRMIAPPELEKFGRWKYNLLTVKPGLTGLWQVSGRSDLSYEERVRLDMYYVRNYTNWLDLHLLFSTIGVVLRGRGAY